MGWEGIEAQRQGVDLNTFLVKDNCVPDYSSPVIITSEKTIKEQPDLVVKLPGGDGEGLRLRREQSRRRGEAADRRRAEGHASTTRGWSTRARRISARSTPRARSAGGSRRWRSGRTTRKLHVRASGDPRRQRQSDHQRAELRRRLHQRLPAEVLVPRHFGRFGGV